MINPYSNIEQQMMDIYNRFSRHGVVVNKDMTKVLSVTDEWTSTEAKECFEYLQKTLQEYKVKDMQVFIAGRRFGKYGMDTTETA